jgi:glycosyltransferase involved in cell wall biosynthesis
MVGAEAQKKLLIISHDKIGSSMAGPGIRYHHMAEVLSDNFDVTIGFFDPTYIPEESFKKNYRVRLIDANSSKLDYFNDFSVVIAFWLNEDMIEYCNRHHIFMVFDIYAPTPVENLALFLYGSAKITQETDFVYKQSCSMYDKFFANGDLFLFSNRRQLDYWVGYVFGTDQIRVSTYKKRPVFDRFIYAPMGIDANMPLNHTDNVIRNKIKGIDKKDKILLWTGGIWNWFDAQTLILAMDLLKDKRPDIKLVFFGTKHPNPHVAEMQEAVDSIALAKRLGLLGKTVFINEGWVDYYKRINYLLEADIAINTTKITVESEFAHRTRVLDHILTGLPTIATKGDYLSDEVIEIKKLGITVPAGDKDAIAKAIIDILEVNNYRAFKQNVESIKSSYDWRVVLAELNSALEKNLPKLDHVVVKKSKTFPNSRAFKTAKRITPVFIKKLIIRTFRYGN